MKKTEKRYMTMKEAMEYTGMGELTLLARSNGMRRVSYALRAERSIRRR